MILNLKGEKREFADGMNALDIAGEISQELKKAALAARLDGEVISLVTPIHGDHDLEILTFDDPDGARVLRHTASHIIGCMERHAGGTIVYGQGNFHFVGFDEQPFWSQGLMISLDFDEGLRVRAIPVVAGEHGIDLAGGEEARAILDGFKARSEELKDGRWLEGWRRFVRENGAGYIDCVRQALDGDETHRECMAHYLDCEAHLDMLRELFRTWHNTQTDGAQEE